MGTKRNPGDFDCYKNAGMDEPIFVLRANDPHASYLVQTWADRVSRQVHLTARDSVKASEALRVADAMDAWAATQSAAAVDTSRRERPFVVIDELAGRTREVAARDVAAVLERVFRESRAAIERVAGERLALACAVSIADPETGEVQTYRLDACMAVVGYTAARVEVERLAPAEPT